MKKKNLLWDEEKNLLFHEWCESGTTDMRRTQIYRKINGSLYQMSKATLRKRLKGPFNYSLEAEHLKESVNDLLVISIGYYDSSIRYNSFSYIYQTLLNYHLTHLIRNKNLHKNSMYHEHKTIQDDPSRDNYIYDNFFVQKNDSDDNTINAETLLNYLYEIIVDVKKEIREREKEKKGHKTLTNSLIYLECAYKYITEFEHFNAHAINEYISNNTSLTVNQIILRSRKYLRVEGDFDKKNKNSPDYLKRQKIKDYE